MNKIKTFTIMLIATLGIVVGLSNSSVSASEDIKYPDGSQVYVNSGLRMHTKRYGEELSVYVGADGWLNMGKKATQASQSYFNLQHRGSSSEVRLKTDTWYKLYRPATKAYFKYIDTWAFDDGGLSQLRNGDPNGSANLMFKKTSNNKYLMLCDDGSIGVTWWTERIVPQMNTEVNDINDVYFGK